MSMKMKFSFEVGLIIFLISARIGERAVNRQGAAIMKPVCSGKN